MPYDIWYRTTSARYIVSYARIVDPLADSWEVARKAKRSSGRCLVAPSRTAVKRAPVQVASELSLLGLPSEIKRMIWREYFRLLADPNEGCVFVEQLGRKYRGFPQHTIWYSREEYGALPGYLDLLLVSREIYREARDVFWLTTSFSFYSHNQLAEFLNQRKKMFSRRPHRYPTQLIRQIRLDISSAYMDHRHGYPSSVLHCLWDVARLANPALKLESHYEKLQTHVAGRRVHYNIDPDDIIASLPELMTRLRAYQAEMKAAGLDLRVSEKQMETWLVADDVFTTKLPPIPQKVAAKKRNTPASKRWTRRKKPTLK
ncbi:hypothetical protein M436DRAFT_67753 [Aureobasidium namibiae CBS 147.97]|uniref:Uncharacterized protein n=1 Tax=Aureobasidium namibiae CBS 147.97 TaxID=1043004 RepID=A0A074WB68_9PEZI